MGFSKVLFRHILISAAFVVLSLSSNAQLRQGGGQKPTKGFITGTVVLSPDEKGATETPGVGVTVSVTSSLKDRKYVQADEKGHFKIFGITPGKAIVSFSMVGYKKQEKVIDISIGPNRIIANLEPDIAELKAAVKKETVNPISVVKDTIIFHASAVKVNPGEAAIDILEQMPGVEVTESGITVLEEQVDNVYVDGFLLFGNAPMAALKNLAAEDIVTIKSYQEYENKDPFHKISRNEEKKRVLDITTKSRPKFVKTVDAIAGGGFDTDSTYHKFRYSLGADANFFSEKLILRASANINNINDGGNKRRSNVFRSASGGGSVDLRDISVSVSARKKWMSPDVRNFVLGSIGGGYTYSDKYDVNESTTKRVYFPCSEYVSRIYETQAVTKTTDKVHTFELSGMKALRDGKISADAVYKYSDAYTYKLSANSNVQDGGAPVGTRSLNDSRTGAHEYSGSISANKGFADRIRLRLSLSGEGSTNTTGTCRIDSTLSSINKTVLDIDGNGSSRKFTVNPSVRWEITENSSLTAGYNYSDTYKKSYRTALDHSDPSTEKLDTVNTHSYTTANKTHTANLKFESRLSEKGAILRVQASYLSRRLGKDEAFPVDNNYGEKFNFLRGSVSMGTESMINRWRVSYSTDCTTPSLEQVRSRINNTNLYSVSVGNPDLKLSRDHTLSFGYSTVLGVTEEDLAGVDDGQSRWKPKGKGKGGGHKPDRSLDKFTTFSLSGTFYAQTDPIVSQKTYFARETRLQKYNYTMPAQSTLTSYENASASYKASLNATFGTPLNKIMCLLNATASCDWDSTPAYLNSDLVRTSNLSPNLKVRFRTNFSRNIRLNLNLNGAYVHSETDRGNKTDYFTERINLGWEFNNIFKHLYVGGNYLKTFTQGMKYGKINDNIFNANIGVRFGPRNNYDISISGHDLFDNTTGYSTSMAEDYVNNVWKHRFGRNVMLTFAYRFNKGGRGRR